MALLKPRYNSLFHVVCRHCAAGLIIGVALFIATLAQGLSDPVDNPQPNTTGRQLSAGCGQPPPEVPPESVTVDGRIRRLIAIIPEDYQQDRAHRLVFAFHGRTNSNARVRGYYNLEQHAGDETLFIYPSGLPQGNGRSWWNPGDSSASLRDYALFDELLRVFSARYCIDLDQVFVVGHSLGASFANSLACARGQKIRGVGTVGGGINKSGCRGQVAAMVLHNPNDRLVDFSHGIAVRDTYLDQNNLAKESVAAEPRRFHCERYGAPEANYPVLWCPHTEDYGSRGTYYPHNWPRGTGKAIMNFFDALP